MKRFKQAKTCSKCHSVVYCSRDCQGRDWGALHHLECRRMHREYLGRCISEFPEALSDASSLKSVNMTRHSIPMGREPSKYQFWYTSMRHTCSRSSLLVRDLGRLVKLLQSYPTFSTHLLVRLGSNRSLTGSVPPAISFPSTSEIACSS